MDYIGEIFHGLLRPRHKRNHRHLYHRRQIGQKMADHNGQEHQIDDGEHFRHRCQQHRRHIESVAIAQKTGQIRPRHPYHQDQQCDSHYLLPSSLAFLKVKQLPVGLPVALCKKNQQENRQDIQYQRDNRPPAPTSLRVLPSIPAQATNTSRNATDRIGNQRDSCFIIKFFT